MRRDIGFSASLLLIGMISFCLPQDSPPPGDPSPEIIPPYSPLQLALTIPNRFDQALAGDPVQATEKDLGELQTAAMDWMREALAPLADPKCRAVLGTVNRAPAVDDLVAKAGSIWDTRPAAAVSGGQLLVPRTLPPLVPGDKEFFHASGLMPFEIALAGEWMRAAGTLHAGPPSADPLLRAARASRLEGAARLAGLILLVKGTGTDPASLGTGILALDKDRAGWPRQTLSETAKDPLVRAALRAFLEDGPRWALFHYLRGGWNGLAGALEKPGGRPEEILRPGLNRGGEELPEGCRFGPRIAAVLLTGNDDPDWVDRLVGDSFSTSPTGGLRAALVFEDANVAGRVASDLTQGGWKVRAEGPRLMALSPPSPQPSEPDPEEGNLQKTNPP